MPSQLIAIAAVAVVISASVGWYAAARLGIRWALALPVLALGASLAVVWRSSGLGFQDGIIFVARAAIFAAPILIGALIGIALHLARSRRGG